MEIKERLLRVIDMEIHEANVEYNEWKKNIKRVRESIHEFENSRDFKGYLHNKTFLERDTKRTK